MLHQHVAQGLVLCLRSYDDHVLVVLGSGADERDAAYVDFSMMSASGAPLATVASNG